MLVFSFGSCDVFAITHDADENIQYFVTMNSECGFVDDVYNDNSSIVHDEVDYHIDRSRQMTQEMPCLVRTKEDRLGWRSEERADLHSWESRSLLVQPDSLKSVFGSSAAGVFILKHWASLA